MRERKPNDWVVDVTERHAVELQVERALLEHYDVELVKASTTSFDHLDFQTLVGERFVELEVKAKRQPLSFGWRQLRPDVDPADLFVLDELALRKLIDAGRYSFLLVRDLPNDRWVLFCVGDLLVASRVRHARRIEKGSKPRMKGKLLFDLREATAQTPTVEAALDVMVDVVERLDHLWSDIAPWPTGRAL
jgi:hypothetical protein